LVVKDYKNLSKERTVESYERDCGRLVGKDIGYEV
jgi:hypothetical protein